MDLHLRVNITLDKPTNYIPMGFWVDTVEYSNTELGIPFVKVSDDTTLGFSVYSLIVDKSTVGLNPQSSLGVEWRLMESAEFIYMQNAYIERLQSALITAEKIIALDIVHPNGLYSLIDGKLEVQEALIKGKVVTTDALIEGSITTPFRDGFFRLTEDGSPIEVSINGLQNNNCVVITGTSSSWVNTFAVPFSSAYNGFRATIINTDWGSNISNGAISASAPSGKYYQERGEYLNELVIGAYEGVEMIGVGKGNVFYGWLILNRFRYGKDKVGDGFSINAVATGFVSSSSSSTSITKQRTFNGSKCTVQRGTSYVDIKLPSEMFTTPNNHHVILTLESGNQGAIIRHSSINSDTIRVNCYLPYVDFDTLKYNSVFCNFSYTIMTSHRWT